MKRGIIKRGTSLSTTCIPLALAIVVAVTFATTQAPAQDAARRLRVFRTQFLTEYRGTPVALPEAPALRRGWVDFERKEFTISFSDAEDELPTGGWLEPGELEELVRLFVDADSWSNKRNSLDVDVHRLVAVQRPETLERIAAFLAALEGQARRRLVVDLALVPPAALDTAAPGWSVVSADPSLEAAALDRVVAAAGDGTVVLSRRVHAGAVVGFSPPRVARHLSEHDVNQTGVIPVVNPVLPPIPGGAYAEARVFPAPDGRNVRLDVVIGRIASTGRETRGLPDGDLELLDGRHERVTTVVVGPLDRTLVLGAVRDAESAANSFVALARVRALFEPARGKKALEEGVRIADTGALTAPILGEPNFGRAGLFSSEYDSVAFVDFGDDEKDHRLLSPDILQTALEVALGEDRDAVLTMARKHASVVLRSEQETAERVDALLRNLAARRLHPIAIDIWQGGVTADELRELGSGGATPGAAALDRFGGGEGLRVRCVGLGGVVCALGAVATHGYLADLERVSGGTGFSIVEVADIVVGAVGEGLVVTVSAVPVPDTTWAQLRIQGERARPPKLGRTVRVRASSSAELEGDGEAAEIRPTGAEIKLDLPEENTERWEHTVTAVFGQPVLLNALPDPDAPGRTRVLLAVVSSFPVDGEER